MTDLSHILEFLGCQTPASWLDEAAKPENLPILLNDHAACELKAAQSAQSLIWKYGFPKPEISARKDARQVGRESLVAQQGLPAVSEAAARVAGSAAAGQGAGQVMDGHWQRLLHAMSRLAREELRHIEQVLDLMRQRGIECTHVSPARYAAGLRQMVRGKEPDKLVDILIVGAFIEARSCERFAALAPLLDEPLGAFYRSLLKSEARHYENYLALARLFSAEPIDGRVEGIRQCENVLITGTDSEFRFHSGAPEAVESK
mgnify:CR=1 FL=1